MAPLSMLLKPSKPPVRLRILLKVLTLSGSFVTSASSTSMEEAAFTTTLNCSANVALMRHSSCNESITSKPSSAPCKSIDAQTSSRHL